MRFTKEIVVLITFILGASPFFLAHSTAWSNPCSVTVSGENVSNNAIQSAINANPGGIICVAAGTYPEQLSITTSGTQLIGLGTILNPTIIEPTSVVTNSYADSIYPGAGIISVGVSGSSITGVVIKNLDIQGTAASSSPVLPANCAAGGNYEGIIFLNAGGTIANDLVNGIFLPPAYAGCGIGILIWSDSGQTSTVSITGSIVSNYGDLGIFCGESGTTCTVSANVVSFYKPYESLTGSVGIIIIDGALATVDNNIVSNNICTDASLNCGPNFFTQMQSAGIGTFSAASGTTISGNVVTHCDNGIGVNLDTTQVLGNVVSGSTDFAIVQYDGSGTYISSHNILADNPIGYEVVNDGGVSASFTSIIGAGNVFGSDTIKIQIQALSPGSVTVNYAHKTYTVSGGTPTPNTLDIH